eukprot:gnl/TRDRNA2_/TRDRNA2_203915_c0_seq1.p1 gnl/TRDRNA2_/TRDRNA2_203915_c0~~gnl/TRDRNA2_/TRDRNA2_203915_c0_seq1.p1  ORF type:complete len:431 (-),score=68.24 gnl/TRDRNA2_/TRDRNA2_203915_c0_seq1:131-1369(-)
MGQVLDVCLEPTSHRGGVRPVGRSYVAPIGTRPATAIGGPEPRFTGRKRALLIGINYTGTRAALKGCHNDVRRMSSLLTRQYGFNAQTEMRILMDDQRSTMPTRKNIMDCAMWLVADARPGDCLFFHYSGHGAQQEDPQCAEEDAMDETILPCDFQSSGQIVDDELYEIMLARLPSGVKLTAVMDCCHSGTGLDLPFTYDTYRRSWIEDDNPCHSEGDVQLFSGCLDDQTSADVQSIYSAASGAMTTAFCDTLESNPAPSYPQLLDGLHRHLRQRGHSQRSQLTSSQRFDLNRTFEICGGICPNKNEQIGRHFRKKKHRKMQWLQDDDPLGDMLTGMVVGDLLFGGPFGGGLLGDPFGGYGGYGNDGYGGYGNDGYGGWGGGGYDGGGGLFGDGGGFGGDFGGDGDGDGGGD